MILVNDDLWQTILHALEVAGEDNVDEAEEAMDAIDAAGKSKPPEVNDIVRLYHNPKAYGVVHGWELVRPEDRDSPVAIHVRWLDGGGTTRVAASELLVVGNILPEARFL